MGNSNVCMRPQELLIAKEHYKQYIAWGLIGSFQFPLDIEYYCISCGRDVNCHRKLDRAFVHKLKMSI
jgi:hypothetical protein